MTRTSAPRWVAIAMWWLPELILTALVILAAVVVGSPLVLAPLIVIALHVMTWALDEVNAVSAIKALRQASRAGSVGA